MRKRPQDFFGPEDYTGGDVEDDVARIKHWQEEWDKEFNKLSWWRKLLHYATNGGR